MSYRQQCGGDNASDKGVTDRVCSTGITRYNDVSMLTIPGMPDKYSKILEEPARLRSRPKINKCLSDNVPNAPAARETYAGMGKFDPAEST